MPRDEPCQTVRRRHIGFLRGLVDGLTEKHHQRRHRREGADERTNHAFSQHHAHVRTDLQPHETQHQQTDYGRQRRRENRRCGFLDSPVRRQYCGLTVGMFVLLLAIAVQQYNTVVQRQHGLQDRTDEVRRDRDGRQQGIRAHVQQDRKTRGHKDHHRLKPTLRHHKKHHHDQHRRENHHRDRRRRTVLARLHHAVSAETVTDLLAEGFLIHGLRYVKVKERISAVRRIAVRHPAHIFVTL